MLSAIGAVALLAVLAAGATILLYSHTLDYGFNYDDYVLVRPHGRAEVRGSFHGSWDTTGVMVPFYRPLTVAFHAVRFELLGLDARRHHALSLTLFACCAALVGWLALRITGRLRPGINATVLYASHPAMPYSLVAWVTNQMHLIETVTVLLALAWWHVVRGRSVAWWLPLLGLGAAAFLIKEDGIMLIPCVVVAHWINRRINEPNLPAVPRLFLIGAALSIAALIALRTSAIGGLGGYGRPTAERAWVNYSTGLDKTMRLVPADRVWQPVASAFVTVLPIAALLTWRRASSRSRACLTIGFTAALLFNVPFALVTKAEQMHLVATGVVLMLTGGAVAVWDAAPRRARPALATGVAAGVLACATVARDISTDFDPFGPVVLANDDIVRGWTAVPAQIHEYLARKREGGRGVVSTNPVAELSHVIFGAHGLETSPDGVRYQWMASPTVNVFVFAAARNITIPLRHEIGAFREPAAAVIELNGRRVDLVRLDTGDWRWSSFGLGSEPPPHRIRISIDRVWHPARIIRGSNDPRALGLQIAKWRCADRMRDSVAE